MNDIEAGMVEQARQLADQADALLAMTHQARLPGVPLSFAMALAMAVSNATADIHEKCVRLLTPLEYGTPARAACREAASRTLRARCAAHRVLLGVGAPAQGEEVRE